MTDESDWLTSQGPLAGLTNPCLWDVVFRHGGVGTPIDAAKRDNATDCGRKVVGQGRRELPWLPHRSRVQRFGGWLLAWRKGNSKHAPSCSFALSNAVLLGRVCECDRGATLAYRVGASAPRPRVVGAALGALREVVSFFEA